MLESDYPHSNSTCPDCITHLEKQLAANPALTADEKKLLLRGNAERVFRFTARSRRRAHTRQGSLTVERFRKVY